MSRVREVGIPMVAIAVLWFVFFFPARSLPLFPGVERLVLVLGLSVVIGAAWPGVTRSLAAGAAAFLGFGVSLVVLGSPIEPDDSNQLPSIAILVATFALYAQLIGTTIRVGIGRWHWPTA